MLNHTIRYNSDNNKHKHQTLATWGVTVYNLKGKYKLSCTLGVVIAWSWKNMLQSSGHTQITTVLFM